ncbi:MAG: nucleotide sugar dehydrogenase [Nibricoccus sp.]
MKIVVLGLWHLGCVTAACTARHFEVSGLDFDDEVVAKLRLGNAPLSEPGLNELISLGLVSGRLSFTTDAKQACDAADVLWVTYDTPVNDNDISDVAAVVAPLQRVLPLMHAGSLVLVSSQLPVGTCKSLERDFPGLKFAASPENLRLGKAIDAFEKAERVIVGTRDNTTHDTLATLLAPFTSQVIFMRTESAEMVKHSINSFLALSITFINEIARLCEHTGADAKEVSLGLKSEPRIGPRAYLGPGGPFAGGTLARDVVTLSGIGRSAGEVLSVIPAIKQSNDLHRGWSLRRLGSLLGDLRGRTIAILGLVYTPGTNTLRRSSAVELCRELLAAGARVMAYDPAVQSLPAELQQILLARDMAEVLHGSDAAVVCTEWPDFRQINWPPHVAAMRRKVFVDANRFLEKQLAAIPGVELVSVGRA